MTRVVLVRHAQSQWNREGRWQGWADPPLSSFGDDQARAAAAALLGDPPARLVASDLRRAARTADLLGVDLRRPISVNRGLREYDAGQWTGLRRDEIAARWPAELAAWDAGDLDRTPGGEDQAAFRARLLRAVLAVRDPHQLAPTVVVSHGRAIHALATAAGAPAAHIDHLGGWELDLGAGDGLGAVGLVRRVALIPSSPAPRRPA